MKKLVALSLILVCVLALFGCTKAGTAAAHSLSDYLVEEEGKQYLILPMSQTRIPVGDDLKQFAANIDVDLLIAAEEKKMPVSGITTIFPGFICKWMAEIYAFALK